MVKVPVENNFTHRCVQRAGDLLYVPDGWAHGVLNLGATVGWANSFFGPQRKKVHCIAQRPLAT